MNKFIEILIGLIFLIVPVCAWIINFADFGTSALFFLKGAAGDTIKTIEIYKGIIPFILLQLLGLGLVIMFPNLVFAFL